MDRQWYQRRSVEVAPELLGAFITTNGPDGRVTARITEVEAYAGADDPVSHAYRGRSARNAAMFGEPGRLYLYRHLGLHYLSLIHISEPTRLGMISYTVFCLKKKKTYN